MATTTPKWNYDSIVKNICPNPNETPNIQVMLGFLGESPIKGHVRLYLSLEMDQLIEIKEKDIKHTESLKTSDNPIGGTMIWISKDAIVQTIQRSTGQIQSDFLQGDITNTFLESTGINGVTSSGPYGIWTIFTSKPCAVVAATIVIYSAIKCKKPKA